VTAVAPSAPVVRTAPSLFAPVARPVAAAAVAPARTLAATGYDTGEVLPFSAALLVIGAALVLVRRLRALRVYPASISTPASTTTEAVTRRTA
jgi:hypothetical protein